MKQRLFIFLGLGILIVILIGLNAVSFSQKEKQPDAELFPNRSTYNFGATGTRAFYDLLAETGRKPLRWTEPPSALLTAGAAQPSTFVIVGALRDEITDDDAAQILKWVSAGGRLVLIDRAPPENLVKTTANWSIDFNTDFRRPFLGTDPSDQQQMTAGMKAARAVQPTAYTKNVNAVQPSVFASSVNFNYFATEEAENNEPATVFGASPEPSFSPSINRTPTPKASGGGIGEGTGSGRGTGSGGGYEAPIVKTPTPTVKVAPEKSVALDAPVVHVLADNRNLLLEVPYGSGRIVFLTDPYIVANGGINLVDNAQLAVNIVAASGGTIAFDEYHQGYGSNQNRLLQYFAETPVVPVMLQVVALIALIFFSQSRRFARPLPENEPDRLSKLEYVAAMAELQQRTKAFDLAIENIYTDFRRRVARLVGVDNFTVRRSDLAQLIAERLPGEKADEIEALMKKCEDIMHGEASNKKEVLRLTARLREIEEKLGLQRRKKKK